MRSSTRWRGHQPCHCSDGGGAGVCPVYPGQERRHHDQLRRLPLPGHPGGAEQRRSAAAEHRPAQRPGKGQGPAGHLQLGVHLPAARHPAELQGPVPPDRGGGLPGHLRRCERVAAQRPGGHRVPGLQLPGGVYPDRAAAGAPALPAARRLARAPRRRHDPGHDEPEKLCGSGGRHRRR